MAVGDIIVGLNIEFSKVSLMMCEVNNFNQLEIKAKASKDVKSFDFKGEIDKDILLPAVVELLDEMEAKTNLHIGSTYISIPGKYSKVIQHSTKRDTKDEIMGISSKDIIETVIKATDVINDETYTEVDIIPDRFVLDNGEMLKNPSGKISSNLTMYAQIIAAKTEYLLMLQSMFKEIDLEIDGYIPKILADKTAVLEEDEINDRILLVDIGEKTTEIGIFLEDSFILTTTLDFGGEDIIRDIQTVLKISYIEARKLKRQYGLALRSYVENDTNILLSTTTDESKKTIRLSLLVEIIEARIEDIFSKINKYLIETGLKQEINNVILIGEGIKDIKKADIVAKVALNLPIKKARSNNLKTISPNFIRTYGTIKYVANKQFTKSVASDVSEQNNKNILNELKEKIKEFFYS